MCGLFGMVRTAHASDDARQRGTETLIQLGICSEERGKDASGLALIGNRSSRAKATAPTGTHAGTTAALIDNTFILKAAARFSELPVHDYLSYIDMAPVVIGHTRWATQGAADAVINASPLLAGNLVGTHNGDIATKSVPRHKDLAKRTLGETDSELAYLALDHARNDRRSMVKVLRSIQGRAALAFVDRARPDRLYLARTALSPLSFAYTGDGDFVYASNPNWFRIIEEATHGRITFRDITLIPEGHLLTVNTRTGMVEDTRRFTPTCRESDLLLINTAVYRAFTAEDKATDKSISRHRVAAKALPAWPTLTPAPKIEKKVTTSGSTLWDESTFDEFDHDTIDLEELEAYCWALGDFDYYTYELITNASPIEAEDLMHKLRHSVAQAYKQGQTAPGFEMDVETLTVAA